MVGSIRWNLIAGCVGFCTTFLASFSSNILTTTLLRSVYSALILFATMFALRFLLGLAFSQGGRPESPAASMLAEGEDAGHKGQHFDFTTPDTDPNQPVPEPNGQTEAEADGFKPLTPPKLATKKEADPEELVKALRHLSEE